MRGSIRCVLVQQLQPPLYAVRVFDGTSVVYTELVEGPEKGFDIAARLWSTQQPYRVPEQLTAKTPRPARRRFPDMAAEIERIMAAVLKALPSQADDKSRRQRNPMRRRKRH
jgi:hypothetical protein